MDLPERIHFFSHVTGVSFELPIGFTEATTTESSAAYADRNDDDDDDDAMVFVNVVGAAEPGIQVVAVDAMSRASTEVVSREDRTIDEESVSVAHLRFDQGMPDVPAGESGLVAQDVFVVFAAVVVAGRLVTVAAITRWADRGRYGAAFDTAIGSCRFIGREEAA